MWTGGSLSDDGSTVSKQVVLNLEENICSDS